MLKAQHPDYEVYMTGVHAKRGVACADCHMPYMSEGGQKFTDHKMQSPLNNIANSCQVCHREEATQLVQDVYERQDKILESRHDLEKQIVRAHVEAKKAWELGARRSDGYPHGHQACPVALGLCCSKSWRLIPLAGGICRTVANGISIVQDTH